MRQRVHDTVGVHIPGIRFRGNEGDLPASTYVIMINEIPLVLGTLPPGKLAYIAGEDAMKAAGITGDVVHDPLTGRPAAWVDASVRHPNVGSSNFFLEAFRRSLWWRSNRDGNVVPNDSFLTGMEFLIRHVEALMMANLAEFLGHQEVLNLLVEQAFDDRTIMQKDLQALSALTTVLRGLLHERVPVKKLARILELFRDEWSPGSPISQVVERIRGDLPQDLPGNSSRYEYFETGSSLEALLSKAIWRGGSEPALAIGPEACREVLKMVRERIEKRKQGVGTNQNDPALVTSPELRPHLRELVKLEWPALPVLSRTEWLPDAKSRLAGRIELVAQA